MCCTVLQQEIQLTSVKKRALAIVWGLGERAVFELQRLCQWDQTTGTAAGAVGHSQYCAASTQILLNKVKLLELELKLKVFISVKIIKLKYSLEKITKVDTW